MNHLINVTKQTLNKYLKEKGLSNTFNNRFAPPIGHVESYNWYSLAAICLPDLKYVLLSTKVAKRLSILNLKLTADSSLYF